MKWDGDNANASVSSFPAGTSDHGSAPIAATAASLPFTSA